MNSYYHKFCIIKRRISIFHKFSTFISKFNGIYGYKKLRPTKSRQSFLSNMVYYTIARERKMKCALGRRNR